MTDKQLNFLNVVPVFLNDPDFTVSEIRRQYRDVGLRQFAICLSLHPQGDPPVKRADALIAHCGKLKEKLSDLPELQFGVLIQSTMGHGWAAATPLTREPWSRVVQLVSKAGEPVRFYEKNSRMCYMDPAFQEYILHAVDGIMKLGPAFLLLDDDFGLRLGECFCDRHMADFNEHNHSHYTREELAKIVLERPGDDPEVRLFSERRGAPAIDFIRRIRQVIDSYDPKTWCFLCTCGRGFAARYLEALAGPESQPCVRPGNAVYGGCQPLDFYTDDRRTNLIKYQYSSSPKPVAFIDEADTFPQSYYSESAAMFHAHLTLAILNGFCGAKVWMSEFNSPEDRGWQSRYETIFRDHRGFYDELFRVTCSMTPLGVASPVFEVPEMDHAFLCASSFNFPSWSDTFLGPFGVPLRWGDGTDGGVYALTGHDASRLDDATIRKLLAGAVLLDGKAAAELDRRGFAADMGVRTVNDPEFFFQTEFTPSTGRTGPLMWETGMVKLEPVSPETQVYSQCAQRMGGELRMVAPCMTFFTNPSGGRVAVTAYPADLPYYKRLRNPRRENLLAALDFLAGGTLEMTVEILNQNLVHHARLADGSELLAVLGLGIDTSPAIPVRRVRKVETVDELTASGEWRPAKFSQADGLVTIRRELRISEWAVFRFRPAKA